MMSMWYFLQNLARDRASRTSWKPVRDISQSIGVPLYAFSFSIGRFRKVKPVTLGCGVNDLNTIKWKYDHLNLLQEFSERVRNIDSYSYHPLNQIGPSFLPEVMLHRLNIFRFRYEYSLFVTIFKRTVLHVAIFTNQNFSMTSNFIFRLISRLSCLFEDNNKEANKVVRHINTLVSTSKQKIKMINISLKNKISMFENGLSYGKNTCM